MGWRITAEDDQPYGVVQGAIGILFLVPTLLLFGFALSFVVLVFLEPIIGANAELLRLLRALFRDKPVGFLAVTTSAFLAICGLVHAVRRRLRPQSQPLFLASILGTGVTIGIANIALILLVAAVKGH
jgi:hypothetical protein